MLIPAIMSIADPLIPQLSPYFSIIILAGMVIKGAISVKQVVAMLTIEGAIS